MTNIIIFWLTVIIIHELGHILAWMILRKEKPRISFKFWGAIQIGEGQEHKLIVRQHYIICLTGVITGIIPFFITNTPPHWILVYLICSGIDLVSIIQDMQIPRWQWNWKLLSVAKYQIKKLEERN